MSLTWNTFRALVDNVEDIVRPWRHYVGRCAFRPTEFAADDQIFIADLRCVFGVRPGEPDFIIVGKPTSLEPLKALARENKVKEADLAAYVVWRTRDGQPKDR